MAHVQAILGVSERRACKVIGQPRASQRYRALKPDKDRALRGRLRELARRYLRYGYRRMWALLRKQGWQVNRKRVQRLWREEGLRILRRQRKRRRLGNSANGCSRLRATHKNHVWSYDFVIDQTEDGRRLKLLAVMDEFTREVHAILVARSITAKDVIELLAYLFSVHGEPEFIRSDNGPEFIANELKAWLARSGVQTLFIEPGSPWENAYVESFNSRLRDELLDRDIFTSLTEAKVLVEQYRLEHNHERPHSSLGYRTPAEFAAEQPSRLLTPASAPNGAWANVPSVPCGAPGFDHSRDEGSIMATLS